MTVEDAARLYDFGRAHPLRPERVLLTYDHIRDLGIGRGRVTEVPAGSATDEQINAVHGDDYIATVKGIDAGNLTERAGYEYGLGTPDNPIFPAMHVASAAVCGATVAAADAVASGRFTHAFNPAGGLHHARAREASGFCIYNDPAVAIAHILAVRPEWRVMYLDVDVHHGDGVQWIFYDDPRVLTLSLHQSGRYLYPGTGFEDEVGLGPGRGTSANIPLEPYTGEDDYLYALGRVLPELAAAFRPDVLVTQLGADTHHGDPLANLSLTMRAYAPMAKLIHDVVHDHAGGRWVATGGGGYQATTVVPRVWTIHFAEMCDDAASIPAEWSDDVSPEAVSRSVRPSVERAVEVTLERCLPLLGSAKP
ncbi:MAG TPA: acetoin utilization protein AcuC [Actinomycetota bacterium]|nr:acetoin utilization protein AcuC [Actinomycetota bacterium]